MLPDALVYIMRFDPAQNTLSLVSSPRFSAGYIAQMQNIEIDPAIGTCGRVAFKRHLVVTGDIDTNPNWKGFRELAHEEGLRACWSMPILSAKDEVLSTFATYYRHPATPSQNAQNCLARSASLATLVLLRHRDK